MRRRLTVPAVVLLGVVLLLVVGSVMIARAQARSNKVTLAESPQPVAVARVVHSAYLPSRDYVGAFESWAEARVGPQFLSAYVATVLVRPGATVKKGQVLATLDCRSAHAASRAIAMEARGAATQERAVASEAVRVESMLDGGFVSPDEAEQKAASEQEKRAQLGAQMAELSQSSLAASDCALRAPFDGEVTERALDPGAFARPGASVVTLVDRSTVRLVADAPETDFALVEPGIAVKVRVYATRKEVTGVISRRAPGTDPETRTVRVEVDVPDPTREIPANTTGEVHIDAGRPIAASEIPLDAARIRGDRAEVFVVRGDVVHRLSFAVIGEIGGNVFLETALGEGTEVVTEGRALLEDGDRVAAVETKAGPR
jgi:RND family efflux transporter MFP subunit